MPESILTCELCGYRFNYLWTPGGSLHAVRRGTVRTFRCPQCERRVRFDLQTRGHNPTLRSFDDTVYARFLLVLLGPVIAASIFKVVMTALFPGWSPLVTTVPVLVGLTFMVVYAIFMIRRGRIPEAPPDAIRTP